MSLRGVTMLTVLAVVAVCITGCPPVTTTTVVSVSPVAATLQIGQGTTLTATSTDTGDASFTWTNSNPAVATIDATTGLAVNVKAFAVGVTTITVVGSQSGKSAVATITVPTTVPVVEPTKVTVTPAAATLETAQVLALSAASTNAADTLTWTQSNAAVLGLSATTGGTINVTALAPGVTVLTVTGSVSGVTATAAVSVIAANTEIPVTPAVVKVTPTAATLETAQILALSAVSTNATDTFTWTQTNAAVAGLSATTGASINVTALTPGVTVITATGSVSGVTATAAISVIAATTENPVTTTPPAGLKVTISGVVIPEDLRAEVTFIPTNDRGDAIPKVELASVRFIIAHLDEAPAAGTSAEYISYISTTVAATADPTVKAPQATTDSAGAAGLTDNGDGTFTYKFKTALPAGYSKTASHVVGGQFSRTAAATGIAYPANAVYEWRPDGNPVTITRDLVTTESCNKCHTRLALHGGGRREVRLCILCHNDGSIDPDSGNTVDMKAMIHKIHMGKNLPSVVAGTPYQIIGYHNSVNDYSSVALPQDIRNCNICHGGTDDSKAVNTQADYRTKPTRAGCGSCHDRTWFGATSAKPAGYENHIGGAQANDSTCAVCHKPADIAGYHTTPEELAENPGLDLHITNVAADPADGTLTINFTAKNGAGAPIVDLAPVARVGSIVAWPASDYTTNKNETIQRTGGAPTGTVVNSTSPTGEYQYIFKAKLPLDAGITFAIAMTGRQDFKDQDGNTLEQGLEDNNLQFFTIDGSTPKPHRQIADDALCANCHGETIRGHGGSRLGVGVCEMCHNSTLGRFNLKDMLHKWHTGAELSRDFDPEDAELSATVAAVRFPGLRQQCSICHGTHNVGLPMAPKALPTVIKNADSTTTTILPERAACTSCHDSLVTDIHAVTNSDAAQGVEACEVCHGSGKAEAVATVHALAP